MRVAAALALCATLVGACSFTFMRPQPPGPPESPAECSTSPALPLVDLAIAAVLVALYLGNSPCRDFYKHECSAVQQAAGPAAVSLPLVASATYGYLQRRRCTQVKAAARRGTSTMETASPGAAGSPMAPPADAGTP